MDLVPVIAMNYVLQFFLIFLGLSRRSQEHWIRHWLRQRRSFLLRLQTKLDTWMSCNRVMLRPTGIGFSSS